MLQFKQKYSQYSQAKNKTLFFIQNQAYSSTFLTFLTRYYYYYCYYYYYYYYYYYRGAYKSLSRPTSRCILFDGGNISFDANLVTYINSTNIPPIMIINRIYEKSKPSVAVACFLPVLLHVQFFSLSLKLYIHT